jgi:beta-1,2-mannobiose phosphorylase / 1,2-beta-oligomannan phosphorylase
MGDIAERFINNPILAPRDFIPSIDGFHIAGVLNPGAFAFKGKTGLIVRVAEMPPLSKEFVQAPILDEINNNVKLLKFSRTDPHLKADDPRVFFYRNETYLTNISHLRLAWSDDGKRFTVESSPAITGQGENETYGIEDCRVTEIDGTYYLTYTAVSENGVAVGLITTTDWQRFQRRGIIFPPHNKDCAIFPGKIGTNYFALHRPSGCDLGGNYIWIARSYDLQFWGQHRCIARTRPGMWDEQRIGAGAAPIETAEGWLEIYHGADHNNRYCLGALLLHPENPEILLARSQTPIMEPIEDYEKKGFFGNVVFSNGHTVDGDRITIYYGASDQLICGAHLSIKKIMASL